MIHDIQNISANLPGTRTLAMIKDGLSMESIDNRVNRVNRVNRQ